MTVQSGRVSGTHLCLARIRPVSVPVSYQPPKPCLTAQFVGAAIAVRDLQATYC